MLVRALKVLDFASRWTRSARVIDTAALISRTMKVALMAERSEIGNVLAA